MKEINMDHNINMKYPDIEDTSAIEQYKKNIIDAFSQVDLSDITKDNNDIKGWIIIPDTTISYPICQTTDNDYYLNHNYKKTSTRVGSIFLDYRVSSDFNDTNTIIYGHRMKDLSMFASLKYYVDQSFWEEHKTVLIYTLDGKINIYSVYSAFEGDPNGLSYNTIMDTLEDKNEFIDYTTSCSKYRTGITPTEDDRFITLSTCAGSGHEKRMIVHGVYIDSIELK